MKEIIQTYKNNIKKIIKNMTGQYNEDIEQEVYIKTWRNINKYKEEGKFKSWLNTLTANICRDYLKSANFKKSTLTSSDEDINYKIADNKIPIENELDSKRRQKVILKAIDSLKPKLKEVIVFYEIKELNYDEISKIIKCPVGTVKSRLYNARKELSIILKDLI